MINPAIVVQLVVLFFICNPILIGVVLGEAGLVLVGWSNCFLLGGIIWSHRSYFKRSSMISGRVVFTPGVFQLLAFAVLCTGLLNTSLFSLTGLPGVEYIILASLVGIFYVASSLVFGLYAPRPSEEVPLIRFVVACLTLFVLSGVGLLFRELVHVQPNVSGKLLSSIETTALRSYHHIEEVTLYVQKTLSPVWEQLTAMGSKVNKTSTLIDTSTQMRSVISGGNSALPFSGDGDISGESISEKALEEDSSQVISSEDVVLEGEQTLRERLLTDSPTPLTYGSLIPELIEQYQLTAPDSTQYSFSFVIPQSPLYEPFRVARWYGMIGTTTSPQAQVACGNLMVILGLAEGREIQQGQDIVAVYRSEADLKGYLSSGCETPQQIATNFNLP